VIVVAPLRVFGSSWFLDVVENRVHFLARKKEEKEENCHTGSFYFDGLCV